MRAGVFDDVISGVQVRALSRCSDCDVLVCDSCVPAHGRSAPSTAHHVITFSDVTHPTVTSETTVSGSAVLGLKCGSHDGQMLKFYCADCETAVCQVGHEKLTVLPPSATNRINL